MWHCDLLEKFPHHALARFVRPDPNDRTKVEVKRVQFTLDTATHPTPGQYYEFVKDEDTGAESFVPFVPKQAAASAPAPAPAPAAAEE